MRVYKENDVKRFLFWAVSFLAVASAVSAQQKKILVTGLTPAAVQELQAAAPQANVVAATREELRQQIPDADGVLGFISPELVRAGKKLKWVQTYSAGVEPYLHRASSQDLRDSDIVLTNCKILQGPEIADHAMALLLALTRDLYQIIPNRTKEEWTRGQHQPVELRGKTAVVIGVGGIGTQIAVRANAFGMKVIGIDPKDIPIMPFLSKTAPPDRLDEVLPEADVVFVSAPHTPRSNRMMGPREFDLMRKNSYFIAVSRGRLYDTDALVKALDSKKLAGAGLDVTNPEPLPKGHPLWKFDNVIITPHIAGRSDQVQERRMELLKANIQRFVAGEPLLNVVDKQKGY
jgi:phosphoglycerate dehydrogenase-like enzyme